MRESRCHFAHRAQARHVNQFGLQFLKFCLGLLMLGEVANKPGKMPLSTGVHLADGQVHWKSGPIPALSGDNASDADDVPFAAGLIASQVAVVAAAIRFRHQNADVLANGFVF